MDKQILIQSDVWNLVPEIFKKFDKVLIVSSQDIYDLFEGKMNFLIQNKSCDLYFIKDYSVQAALELAKHVIVNYYECIVSVGGGTVNDTCKLAAKYSEKKLISVPTIISNDGVCSNTSVLKFDGDKTDGLPSKSPDAVLIDIDIIKASPQKYHKYQPLNIFEEMP
ncbi:iron-containing alcohol dehydrogenase family protein [bacterium]|nr:iron-containing alcohol dehydrogenase family protein [bacterium]